MEPKAKDYNAVITVNTSPAEAFKKIAAVGEWWAKSFKGKALNVGDTFTVQFGKTTVDFEISEAIADKKIVWHVTDCHLPWLKDVKEWKGTDIIWVLTLKGNGTEINMTHIGIATGVECFEACQEGWNGHIKGSLVKLINDGKGKPGVRNRNRIMIKKGCAW